MYEDVWRPFAELNVLLEMSPILVTFRVFEMRERPVIWLPPESVTAEALTAFPSMYASSLLLSGAELESTD